MNQRGSAALTIRTIAKAKCSIDVQYDSGSSTAKGLGSKTADADGLIRWKWLVGSNTAAGEWPILVTCVLGDRSGDLVSTITVK